MKKFFALAVCLIACQAFLTASALQDEGSSGEGLSVAAAGKFMTYYYINPDPGRLIQALKFLLTQDSVIAHTGHFRSIGHFFAAAAYKDKNIIRQIKKLKSVFPGIRRKRIVQIVNDAENFRSPEPMVPADLDMLWSEFMATGDEAPVKKIIAALAGPDTGRNILLIGAAEWSLASNGVQHERVRMALENEALSAAGVFKDRITRILSKIRKIPDEGGKND